MEKFAERLKSARKKAGMEQAELAEIVKISAITLSRYENGHRKPNIDDTAKLAAALNTSVSYLMGESGTHITANDRSIISGNIVSSGVSGNAVVGLCDECVITKAEQHIHAGEEEITRGTVVEYHEGSTESDKKIKLTFPSGTPPEEMKATMRAIISGISRPSTSPEEMEAVVERTVRAILGSVSHESLPKQPVKTASGEAER